MGRWATRALAAAALAIAAAGARAEEEAPSARVVTALPAEGRVGLLHLYGMRRDGRAFDVPETLRLWDGWDLVLFRVEGIRPDEIAALVVCNEALREVEGQEPALDRVCSPAWTTPLPEPGREGVAAAGALVAGLAARRRRP